MVDVPSGKFKQTVARVGHVQVISAADELFNHVDGNLPMWAGDGDRSVRVQFYFTAPFDQPPAMTLGVVGIDCDHNANLRYRLEAETIGKTGFEAVMVTWGDTHIARASISWQAIGQVPTRTRPMKVKPGGGAE